MSKTFEIPAGYEHAVRDITELTSQKPIQQALIDLWREVHADPAYLLLREESFVAIQRFVGGCICPRPDESGGFTGQTQRLWFSRILNQTTGTMLKLEREDRLAPGTMMFLYRAEGKST